MQRSLEKNLPYIVGTFLEHSKTEGHFPTSKHSKRALPISRHSKWASEGHLYLVLKSDGNLIKTRVPVQAAVMRFSSQLLKHLVDKWKREMVFSSRGIQFSVINIDSPPILNMGWHQLTIIILHSCNSRPFRHYMHWADPLAIKDRANHICIQKFLNFLLHHFHHWWIQPPLWFLSWLAVFFQ